MNEEKLKNMEMGDIEWSQYDRPSPHESIFHTILRVPGGWIMTRVDWNNVPLAAGTFVPEVASGKISESVFNGKDITLSLADVGYHEIRNNAYEIVLKGWRPNKYGEPSNMIVLGMAEGKRFAEAWKKYRHEKDGV